MQTTAGIRKNVLGVTWNHGSKLEARVTGNEISHICFNLSIYSACLQAE